MHKIFRCQFSLPEKNGSPWFPKLPGETAWRTVQDGDPGGWGLITEEFMIFMNDSGGMCFFLESSMISIDILYDIHLISCMNLYEILCLIYIYMYTVHTYEIVGSI